jgi:hypothetical protein
MPLPKAFAFAFGFCFGLWLGFFALGLCFGLFGMGSFWKGKGLLKGKRWLKSD